MNILQLRTLAAVETHQSFADAAEYLHVTPAAVSQQMRALEDEIGAKLFDRSTRPPKLNAHGALIAERARNVLADFDALKALASSPDEIAGTLLLGTGAGVGSDLVPEALANLRARHPKMRVRIVEGMSDDLANMVRRRDLDAAIITAPLVPEQGLLALPIKDEPLIAIAPAGTKARTWREMLTERPFLRLTRRSGIGAVIDATLRQAAIEVEEAMELDSSEVILALVKAGLGAGVVPQLRLAGQPKGAFKALPFGDPPVLRRIVLVERAGHQNADLAGILYMELKRLSRVPQ